MNLVHLLTAQCYFAEQNLTILDTNDDGWIEADEFVQKNLIQSMMHRKHTILLFKGDRVRFADPVSNNLREHGTQQLLEGRVVSRQHDMAMYYDENLKDMAFDFATRPGASASLVTVYEIEVLSDDFQTDREDFDRRTKKSASGNYIIRVPEQSIDYGTVARADIQKSMLYRSEWLIREDGCSSIIGFDEVWADGSDSKPRLKHASGTTLFRDRINNIKERVGTVREQSWAERYAPALSYSMSS